MYKYRHVTRRRVFLSLKVVPGDTVKVALKFLQNAEVFLQEGALMPLFFCCKCRELITADFQADPDTFLCERCKTERLEKKGHPSSSKSTAPKKEKEMEICTLSDWEIR